MSHLEQLGATRFVAAWGWEGEMKHKKRSRADYQYSCNARRCRHDRQFCSGGPTEECWGSYVLAHQLSYIEAAGMFGQLLALMVPYPRSHKAYVWHASNTESRKVAKIPVYIQMVARVRTIFRIFLTIQILWCAPVRPKISAVQRCSLPLTRTHEQYNNVLSFWDVAI